MIYLAALFAAAAAALTAGGSFRGLADIRFKKGWLFPAAFMLQVVAGILFVRSVAAFEGFTLFSCVLSYALLAVGFWMNRHITGMLIAGAGMMLNAVVMTVNGGRMPVDTSLLEKHGMQGAMGVLEAGADARHIPLDGSTRLDMLADRFHPPSILSVMNGVISIGDMVIAAGLFAMVFGLMYNVKRA